MGGGLGGRRWALAGALVVVLGAASSSHAVHLSSDTEGHSTLEQLVTGGRTAPSDPYANLHVEAVNRQYLVRDAVSEGTPGLPTAGGGRETRRVSLAYFGQLTDFQLADEESPARYEFLDNGPAGWGWRPQEALAPFVIDYSIRQMNRFAAASPVPQGNGARAAMGFALVTGDQADSQQRNETRWVRELLEGGRSLNFNSGSTNQADYDPVKHPSCDTYRPNSKHLAEALKYTGVQDYNDYKEGTSAYFYDPDDVRGFWASKGWPTYRGLMDRAQQLSFVPAGLDVPSYVTNGNHDALVQGVDDAVEAYEDVATGCKKALGSTQSPSVPGDPSVLLTPSSFMLVPPDPERRYVSKPQVKAVYGENNQDHDHGFEFIDPAEDAASNGSASYYAWSPPEAPGFRFISLDTVSEGGAVETTGRGNIDDPQFRWLERELQTYAARGRIIVVFGHHPVRSLTADVADEQAPPCTGSQHLHGDTPEHNHNPGCDVDPRDSAPVHLGRDPVTGDPRESLVELFDRFPNVIAYISGHTHVHNVEPFPRTGGGVWWGIETSATADWPQQHRLIEVMDNRDRTLSIFGTILDHASPAAAPPPGSAASFSASQLAAIGRAFAYNEPQAGAGSRGGRSGEGEPKDQDVELLVPDPRSADLSATQSDSPDPVQSGSQLTYTVTVRNRGPSRATGVRLTDDLPASVVFSSATSSRGSCLTATQMVTCSLGDLPNGQTATVSIVVIPQSPGTITNRASVTGILNDPVPANNTTSAQSTVNSPP